MGNRFLFILLASISALMSCNTYHLNDLTKEAPPIDLTRASEKEMDIDSLLKSNVHYYYKRHQNLLWELFLTSAIDHSSGAVNIPWDLKGQQGFIGKINLGELTDSIWSTSRKANFTENDSLENFSLNFEGCLGSLYSMAANNCEDWTDTWSAIEVTGGDLPPSLAH